MNPFQIVTDGDTYGSADAFWFLGITDAEAEALASGAVKPQELPAEPVHIGRILRALRAARDGWADARDLAASILADLEPRGCEACAQRRRDDPPEPIKPAIITVDDIVRFLLPIFPDVQVDEDFNGEIVIFTGAKVASSDGHLAPLPSAPEDPPDPDGEGPLVPTGGA